MNGTELLLRMSDIDNDLISEAEAIYTQRQKTFLKKWIVAAACFCLCFCFSVPALAATGIDPAYEMLYSISPYIAQKLKPVNESCIDNGIEMKVVAAEIYNEKAEILISLRDTIDSRIDNTTDLSDSYWINTPYDMTCGCFFAGYDPDTRTVSFLLSIEQMDHMLIPGDKVTFTVGQLMVGRRCNEYELIQAEEKRFQSVPTYSKNPRIRGVAGYDHDIVRLMIPDEDNPVILEEGVSLTGTGIVDDEVHVQIHYDNILTTDNHGYVYLKKKNGETIYCKTNIAFWDETRTGSYEEYIFPISADEIQEYEVWGKFWTNNNEPIKGKWQVTIPVQGKE